MSMEALPNLPEIEGIRAAGVNDEELMRIAQHPYTSRFLRDKFEDVEMLSSQRVQEGLRVIRDEPESLVEVTDEDLDRIEQRAEE